MKLADIVFDKAKNIEAVLVKDKGNKIWLAIALKVYGISCLHFSQGDYLDINESNCDLIKSHN